jgi:hypothetical protein
MKVAIAAALIGAALAWAGPAAAQVSYDGAWAITLSCPDDASGAKGFSYDFNGRVDGSMLHARHGIHGEPGFLTLDGQINARGDASLVAEGLTASPLASAANVDAGVPFTHPVTAHFEARRGDGSWTTTRECDFTFRKIADPSTDPEAGEAGPAEN